MGALERFRTRRNKCHTEVEASTVDFVASEVITDKVVPSASNTSKTTQTPGKQSKSSVSSKYETTEKQKVDASVLTVASVDTPHVHAR